MSDEESHSESEFYYPKDEEQAKSEQDNMSKVITHEDENVGNSQEELQKFVQEQKSENTVKKTSRRSVFTVFLARYTRQMFRFWTYHRKNLTTSWESFLKGHIINNLLTSSVRSLQGNLRPWP